ncbi:MAG TPA: R2-like ligand-binding oxidase [Ktedonobacteraceae bacterium]|nr:R2-like ligand-binding oxidase [Ktedonobacteraceae bacterium]
MTVPVHERFITTSGGGLRHDILPMRLYHKAKRLGVWDPRGIDFSQDMRDWQDFTDQERESILSLTALFQSGEEGVTLDLLPLILTMAREQRLEEEMFLTTFLWEEAKHTEFFRRFLDEVAHETGDLARYHTASYRTLFYEELPKAMNALLTDHSPEAQVRASVTYNMIVEGVLAETGYYSYYNMLERNNVLPGLRQGIGLLKRDESRHIAYGVYLISRLVAQQPELWEIVEKEMNRLLVYALGVVSEPYQDPSGEAPAEQTDYQFAMQETLDYAVSQFTKRMNRIERARTQTLEQIYQEEED